MAALESFNEFFPKWFSDNYFKQFDFKIDLSLIMSDAKARDPRAGLIKLIKWQNLKLVPQDNGQSVQSIQPSYYLFQ